MKESPYVVFSIEALERVAIFEASRMPMFKGLKLKAEPEFFHEDFIGIKVEMADPDAEEMK